MDIKKLRVCTSNDKQFLKEFSDIFESHFDELGGNWLKHKNCNTTLDSHWFFRTKLWELVKVRYDIGIKTVEELSDLSGFAVCTLAQRKFLDEIREKFEYMGDEENAFDHRDGHSILDGYDFEDIDLQKVIRGE